MSGALASRALRTTAAARPGFRQRRGGPTRPRFKVMSSRMPEPELNELNGLGLKLGSRLEVEWRIMASDGMMDAEPIWWAATLDSVCDGGMLDQGRRTYTLLYDAKTLSAKHAGTSYEPEAVRIAFLSNRRLFDTRFETPEEGEFLYRTEAGVLPDESTEKMIPRECSES